MAVSAVVASGIVNAGCETGGKQKQNSFVLPLSSFVLTAPTLKRKATPASTPFARRERLKRLTSHLQPTPRTWQSVLCPELCTRAAIIRRTADLAKRGRFVAGRPSS